MPSIKGNHTRKHGNLRLCQQASLRYLVTEKDTLSPNIKVTQVDNTPIVLDTGSMKSIKEIAEDLGISKQAVNARIKKLNLQSKCQMVNGRWLIPDEVFELLKENRPTNNRQQTTNQTIDSLIEALRVEQMLHAETLKRVAELEKRLLPEAPGENDGRNRLRRAWDALLGR